MTELAPISFKLNVEGVSEIIASFIKIEKHRPFYI
jgi:hypothetical protein